MSTDFDPAVAPSRGSSTKSMTIPSDRRVAGTVVVPPSKSLTIRALLLSLLSPRLLRLEGPLISADTERVVEAIRACGRVVERIDSDLVSSPGLAPATSRSRPVEIHCGSSATLLRLLLGVLVTRPGHWVLDGSMQLRRRPVGPLIDALRRLGVEVSSLDRQGFAPLYVRGCRRGGGRVTVDASLSSQFLSALILAGVGADEPLEVHVDGLTSGPYVDLTMESVRRFGGLVTVDGERYRVAPGLRPPASLGIEGDYSSAAYFAAAAALTGGEVLLAGIRSDSVQGDRAFLDLLARMGATVEVRDAVTRVRGGAVLEAVEVDMGDMPDQVPTLAAIAPFARGVTRITGVPHLRIKESDRLSAMARELDRVGATAEESPQGLDIHGLWADHRPPREPILVDTHDDHRIAMSMAVLGLRRGGLSISHPEVVEKSNPVFWRQLFGVLEA